MSDSQSENPLMKALPPATDYLSYLTIVEYNMSEEQLPLLHEILQDETLTVNIGWDLVHLLTPLLPHSKPCLQDVARLGNPREVVLKVAELLEKLANQNDEDGDEDQENSIDGEEDVEDGGLTEAVQTESAPNGAPSRQTQFCALLDMLKTLLPRIKTKFPSRFLSTSLEAILPAYARIAAEPEATEAVITLIKALSGTSRPKLPPRASSTIVLTQNEKVQQSAPDPEGNEGSIGSDEEALQKHLLQAFLTFVVEAWMDSLDLVDDVPGMAWCSRIQEHDLPRSIVPGRRTFTELFDSGKGLLHSRDATMGQLTAISRDLSISSSDLLETLTTPSSAPSSPNDLPSTASEVPLSLPGALYLLVASLAASNLFGAPYAVPSISLFPQYACIVIQLIGNSSPTSAGTEALALIDGVLALNSAIATDIPATDIADAVENFNETVQRLALLSANTPNASLRYKAHLVTKDVLHAHPDANVRMAYIKDTLEHCPYENLKASAVGWLKDEIMSAADNADTDGMRDREAIFRAPAALSTLKAYLFINPKKLIGEGDYTSFLAYQSFLLAVLNLMYLILSSQSLKFSSRELRTDLEQWLQQLKGVSHDVRNLTEAGVQEGEDRIPGLETDLSLLEGNVELVEEALSKQAKEPAP